MNQNHRGRKFGFIDVGAQKWLYHYGTSDCEPISASIMPFKICKKVFKLEITSMKVGDSDVCDATFCWWQFENLGDTIFMLAIKYVSGINSQICHWDTAVLLYWCWWHMLNTIYVGNKHSLPTSVSHDNFQSYWLVLFKGKLDAIKLMVSYGFRLSFLNSS